MKSYTDLEQSKKLAEFLQLESADMYYSTHPLDNYYNHTPYIGKYSAMHNQIPCWSLAALLNVLPDEITDDDNVYRNMVFHLKGKYIIQYPALTTLWPSLLSVEATNIIDACYEMILKLHEHKML